MSINKSMEMMANKEMTVFVWLKSVTFQESWIADISSIGILYTHSKNNPNLIIFSHSGSW